jgi:hypothetical protein
MDGVHVPRPLEGNPSNVHLVEEGHRSSSNSSRALSESLIDSKVSLAILNSLETLNGNISTLDSNSKSNFASIVYSLESSNKKN